MNKDALRAFIGKLKIRAQARFFDFLNRNVLNILSDHDTDSAIEKAKYLGEVLWKNPCGVFELAELELTLLSRVSHVSKGLSRPTDRIGFGHVLTKAYETGGHTRVVERILGEPIMQDSGVIVTEACAPRALDTLSRVRHGLKVVGKSATGVDRVLSLAQEFLRFDTLILYLHPYDIETVLAAGVVKKHFGLDVLFFNHADHVFSYGFSVSDRVLEISHFGWSLRKYRKIIDKSVFVGIPLNLGCRTVERAIDSRAEVPSLLSAGTAYKYHPDEDFSFPRFVRNLVSSHRFHFTVIGPSWWDWRWFYCRVKCVGGLKIVGRINYDAYLNAVFKADAYVDSFPVIGGSAFPEAFALGVTCFGVYTGSHGYSPADMVRSASVDSLISDIADYISNPEAREVYFGLDAVIRDVHDPRKVCQRIVGSKSVDSIGLAPPWPNKVPVEPYYYITRWQRKLFMSIPVHVFPKFLFLLHFQAYKFLFFLTSRIGL